MGSLLGGAWFESAGPIPHPCSGHGWIPDFLDKKLVDIPLLGVRTPERGLRTESRGADGEIEVCSRSMETGWWLVTVWLDPIEEMEDRTSFLEAGTSMVALGLYPVDGLGSRISFL